MQDNWNFEDAYHVQFEWEGLPDKSYLTWEPLKNV